jgi:hypothetical protein
VVPGLLSGSVRRTSLIVKKVIVILVVVAAAVAFLAYRYDQSVRRAIAINAMDVLHSDYAELREHGSFTIRSGPSAERVYSFTNSYVIGGTNYQCVLAAEVPRFIDRGFFAITTNEVFIWIDRVHGPVPLLSSGFPPPSPPGL